MNIDEMREKDDDALGRELLELRREAFNLRMQRGTGQLARPSRFRAVRKEIARLKTVQRERSLAATP
jgi:large subunit ribosomal protein L29